MSSSVKELIFSNKINSEIRNVQYGTTGYRMNCKYLDGIMVRMSILAAMRSIYKVQSVGIMVTASHNLECDNGIKLIDPNGDMLIYDWESIAMELIQWDEDNFLTNLEKKCLQLNISFHNEYKGHVLIGFDTRKSSPHLVELASCILKELGSDFSVFPLVTTPQLHFFVKQYNENLIRSNLSLIEVYFERLSSGFCKNKAVECYPQILNVDCANGVGALHLLHLRKMISSHLELRLHNTSRENLNFDCGADYVKIKRCPPLIHNGDAKMMCSGNRWCSIDGDADRLVYFYLSNDSNRFHLLDGDKIAVLIGDYLRQVLKEELEINQFSAAIIQTAYANTASTEFIENHLKLKTECVPNGVKYLHEAAKKYDVGIYFEANGHGTVLFSEKLIRYLNSDKVQNRDLLQFISIINEADGDAISDLLIIEHILFIRKYNLEEWDSLYTDYPSRQLKVPVSNQSSLLFNNQGYITSPLSLQVAIDKAVSDQLKHGIKHARAFMRRSGTEDIIRIYAESSTHSAVDELAEKVKLLIENSMNDDTTLHSFWCLLSGCVIDTSNYLINLPTTSMQFD